MYMLFRQMSGFSPYSSHQQVLSPEIRRDFRLRLGQGCGDGVIGPILYPLCVPCVLELGLYVFELIPFDPSPSRTIPACRMTT